jgi:hypothetical protein
MIMGSITTHRSRVAFSIGAALLCAVVAGCATAPQAPAESRVDERAACLEIFRRVDHAVLQAQVSDGMAARVSGFPYLRVNRFLASYARDEMDDAQFRQWMKRLMALGTEAYSVELGNLRADEAHQLAQDLGGINARYTGLDTVITECAERLAALDARDEKRRTELRAAVRVPDDYATWQRIVGLYWITRLPFAAGIRRWHEETRALFEQPLEALPVKGRLQAYLPPPKAASFEVLPGLLERATLNPLAIPDPSREDLETLFGLFAPAFVIDTAGIADEPGELGWGQGDGPQIVSKRPVVYRRASHARYGGHALLQLNYAIWFPERPKGAGSSLLGGQLDGVLWRVTLAPDGMPWVYDSIHLCGCYHLFFPTARAIARPQPDTLDEKAFVPQVLSQIAPGTRLTLRLASGTHYLERITVGSNPVGRDIEYRFEDDDKLRSLPLPDGGRRSVFRPDGIVAGSERAERYVFWPMGIAAPGAMRQWGRHATAFVGRRHFDDPGLLESYFALESVNRQQ